MNRSTTTSRDASQRRRSASFTAAAGACLMLLSAGPALALTPPPVPEGLEAPAETKLFRVEHAEGTQNYICLPSAQSPSGFAWVPVGPQATLFNAHQRQTMTHFLSPNPEENGVARATWQDSRDTSRVWAAAFEISDDSAYVAPDAIPWLLLEVKGAESGIHGRERISRARWIQRVNTSGGKAPAIGCAAAGDVGKREFIPYEADYLFYKLPGRPT
jgi:hypothetical protein